MQVKRIHYREGNKLLTLTCEGEKMNSEILGWFVIYMLERKEEIEKLTLLDFDEFILLINIQEHFKSMFFDYLQTRA